MRERNRKLDASVTYLRGECVCPFARKARFHAVDVCDAAHFYRPQITRHAMAMHADPGSVLLVAGQCEPTFADTKRWARKTFLELMIACVLATDPPTSGIAGAAQERAVERAVYGDIKDMLYDDGEVRRPNAVLGDQPLITICMAPVYPAAHPRYAPHPILVATRQADVAGAQVEHPLVVKKIREAMLAAQGSVYDADELVLLLPDGDGDGDGAA